MKKQVELSITHNGKDVVAYPYTKKEHVQFENGMNIDEFVGQDIATPTITHDTTAIKVGVGDSDVSSSVVDSAVNMTIKGQTYQNILPEPTLRNEMQGKSMQRLNEGYDSIETVDGVSKSAILKGQTLVNLVKTIQANSGATLSQDSTNRVIKATSNGKAWSQVNIKLAHLKPNTNYIIMFDKVVGEVENGYAGVYDPNGSLNSVSGLPNVSGNNYTTSNFFVVRTREDSAVNNTSVRFHLNGTENDVTDRELNIEIHGLKVLEYQEGMENWNIPYFEGMASCKMPVLTTIGKNLFNKETVSYNTIIDGKGNASTNANYVSSDFIRIKENTTYYTNGLTVVIGYDTNKQSLGYLRNYSFDGSFTTPANCNFVRIRNFSSLTDLEAQKTLIESVQFEQSSTSTPYEPYKSNILHTSEEVVLKGIGDVQDTLNCNTGEYVERIKEVVFDGSDDEVWGLNANWSSGDYCAFWEENTGDKLSTGYAICDKIPTKDDAELINGGVAISEGWRYMYQNMYIFIAKSKLPSADINGLKQYLSQNPITVQYELATPTIKTVDLTTSGNWEKVVLDGSESWTRSMTNNNYFMETNISILPNRVPNVENYFIHDSSLEITKVYTSNTNIGICIPSNGGIRIRTIEVQKGQTLEEFKQYLQQNPITVWYQTTTTQDNSIREMLSFANGHLQVSSEAENSLLPFVQYEIPTKNSYHMDLMKTNTLYTMKAKTVSGTFTIDGTSYNVNANGTFTSPSSMTDKLLIMSNKTNEEVMLLEGNVVDKTIPYFKGIKSAFEGEDKIEVLSTGKNWYPFGDCSFMPSDTGAWYYTSGVGAKFGNSCHRGDGGDWFYLEAGRYIITFNLNNSCTNLQNIGEGEVIGTVIKNDGWYTLRIKSLPDTLTQINVTEIQIVKESTQNSSYEPYKSNTTKIPLLSPLRSSPNGVCDELIIDRLNHKAKLIQRVGYEVLNENTAFSSYPKMEKEKTLLFQTQNAIPQGASTYCISDQFIHRNNLWDSSDSDTEAIMIGGVEGNNGKRIDFRISKAKVSTNNVAILQSYLSKEPITVLYELATPIIIEIDLEGYPYAYKDGHIFFNSDIAPTTQITYSINQAQQIESANENLQRHEKEISHLQKLIAQYIQVEYESTLLSLKI